MAPRPRVYKPEPDRNPNQAVAHSKISISSRELENQKVKALAPRPPATFKESGPGPDDQSNFPKFGTRAIWFHRKPGPLRPAAGFRGPPFRNNPLLVAPGGKWPLVCFLIGGGPPKPFRENPCLLGARGHR